MLIYTNFCGTPESVAKHNIATLSILPMDKVLDAGSGNLVYYNNLPPCEKFECESSRGVDFLTLTDRYDWIIGNPPFQETAKWFLKAAEIANKGIAFLNNNQALVSLTPLRLQKMHDLGFNISGIHIINVKQWYGRYYWIIFEKNKPSIINWHTKVLN